MKGKNSFWMILMILVVTACGSDEPEFYPKPRGYMRLDFPDRTYERYQNECDFSFEMPEYFEIKEKEHCNKDVIISRFNAQLFLTYIPLDTNLNQNIEYSQKLVYDHSIKADEIQEAMIQDPENKRYGMKYNIVGNAASPYQFYLTDSTDHFIRGALYFNVAPNYDSLKPSLDYVVEDIDHLIETVTWIDDSTKVD